MDDVKKLFSIMDVKDIAKYFLTQLEKVPDEKEITTN